MVYTVNGLKNLSKMKANMPVMYVAQVYVFKNENKNTAQV